MLSYGSHQLDEDDILAVADVLRHGWLTQGDKVPEFERALAAYVDCRHAVCVSSGTAALHLACLALGINHSSRVWIPAITFVASANCARYCGAEVDFVDVHAATGNMCLDALEKKLILAEAENSLPELVIVVDLTGRPMDMDELQRLKQRYGFKIIDDASHALGAEYPDGKKVGSHVVADITTVSFHPVKPITTAEGGAALTDQTDLAELIAQLRTHGILRSSDQPPWYYDQQCLGFNYRMSDLQAALGISQLNKIDKFIQIRQKIADRYNALAGLEGIELPPAAENGKSGWHLYTIRITDEATISRDEMMEKLHNVGIGVQLHYLPVYSHSYYRQQVGMQYRLDNSESYAASAISLPIHCNLTAEQQQMVISQVKTFLG